MKKVIELTGEQYNMLVSIMQKKALEIVAWIASLESVQRDADYQCVRDILQAIREAKEVE